MGTSREKDLSCHPLLPAAGWTLRFMLAGGRVVNGWNAQWSQSGGDVTARNAAWNATLAPGAGATIGFNGARDGSGPVPAAFTLNETTCATG